MKTLVTLISLIIITNILTAQVPNLNSPINGSSTWASVDLNWDAAIGINYGTDSYELQVATDIDFNNIVVNETQISINSISSNADTKYYVSDILFGQIYYWRVRVLIDGTSPADWSSVWSFNTRDYVTLNTPTSGASTWTGTEIDWDSHTGVDFYHYQLDTVPTFDSPVLIEGSKAYINSVSNNADTEQYFENLYFGKTYYWRVCAENAVDISAWSEVRTFNTRDYVTLDTPANGASTWTGVEIDWDSHSGVDFYHYQLDTVPTFDSPVLIEGSKAYINSISNNADTEQYFENLYFGKTYYWRVCAENAVDISAWSEVRTFNTRDYVTLDTPVTGASTWTGTEIDWDSHTGVDFYHYQLDTVPTFDSPVLIEGSKAYINSVSNNADTEQYFENLYFGKTYYWRVCAENAVDISAWSEVRTFNTRDYVTIIYPANETLNISSSGVELNWDAHHGVDYYILELDSTNQFNSDFFIRYEIAYINSNSSNADTEQFTGALAENTVYFWRVKAKNSVDSCEWTTRWFSTGNAPLQLPEIPNLVSPANSSLYNYVDITFNWNDANYATSYILEYADNQSFNNSIIESSILNSEFIVSSLDNNTVYYWRVRATDGTNISDWSETWNFTTNLASTVLISPANNSISQQTSLILNWQTVTNATEYEYQYSTDETFSTISESGIISENEKEIAGLDYETEYFWRVRALNSLQTSAWSDTWNFTTQIASNVFENNNISIKLYPNPVNQYLKIISKNKFSYIEIISASGKIIKKYEANSNYTEINTSNLQKGIYFVKLIFENNSYIYKIIKE